MVGLTLTILLTESICVPKAEKCLQRIGGTVAQCNVKCLSLRASITVSTAHVKVAHLHIT